MDHLKSTTSWTLSWSGVSSFPHTFFGDDNESSNTNAWKKTPIENWDNSVEWFPERHSILKLIERWNRSTDQLKIVKEEIGDYRFTLYNGNICISSEEWANFESYCKGNYFQRYPTNIERHNYIILELIDFIFYNIRACIKLNCDLGDDSIDTALKGNLGRQKNSEWLRRAMRKNNSGLIKSERIHDWSVQLPIISGLTCSKPHYVSASASWTLSAPLLHIILMHQSNLIIPVITLLSYTLIPVQRWLHSPVQSWRQREDPDKKREWYPGVLK